MTPSDAELPFDTDVCAAPRRWERSRSRRLDEIWPPVDGERARAAVLALLAEETAPQEQEHQAQRVFGAEYRPSGEELT